METLELILWIVFGLYLIYCFIPLFIWAIIAIVGVVFVSNADTSKEIITIPPFPGAGAGAGPNLPDMSALKSLSGEMPLKLLKKADMFPSVVAVQTNATGSWQVSCFGAAIRPDWVMTSAHCRTDGAHHQVVLLKTRKKMDNRARRVSAWHIHERYDSNDAKYDIALAQLDVQSNDYAPFTSRVDEQPVTSAVACIWRTVPTMERRAYLTDTLDSFTLDSFDQTVCQNTYKVYVDESLICANLSSYKNCVAREFGPLFHGNKLVGILALGPFKCSVKEAIFTNVTFYSSWIFSVLG